MLEKHDILHWDANIFEEEENSRTRELVLQSAAK